jgi:hypothetical protein
MSRFSRLTPVTLTSYAAYLLLAACGDGGDGGGVEPDGGSAGGAFSAAGSSSGVPNSPQAGKSGMGGAPGAAGGGGTAGVAATGGAAAGGPATGGAATGGTTMGGASSGGSGGNTSEPCGDDGDIQCGGACVDPETSEQHCGGCGKACAGGQQCEDGECACSGELDLCGGACVDTDTDERNCGACGTQCGSGQTCESGKCSGGSTGGTSCSNITEFGTVSATIVVKSGETYDGQCRRYRADASTLGDGSQDEGQKPVFVIEDGGKLINVVLGAPAADGIHTKGDVTLENITWEDIGEDAMTIKESGTVVLNGGSAKNGEDKVFQINAASTFRVSNFKASNAGKFIRQNGGTTFKVQVFIDKCDISDMDEAIFRTDSSSSTVSMTNTRYHAIGDALFIGVSSGNITQSNNTQY